MKTLFGLVVIVCFGLSRNLSQAVPTIVGAQAIQSSGDPSAATSLSLPSGCQLYVYGVATGGARPMNAFTSGQAIQLKDADGYVAAQIVVTTDTSNSYVTDTSYHVIGGFGASGYRYVQGFYGSNSGPAATFASVQFTLAAPAMIAVLGVASSQTALTLSGVDNLVADVPVQMNAPGTEALAIAHTYLAPGTYTIQETTSSGIEGQDPNHQADLIGVLIFSDRPSAAKSDNPQIPLSPSPNISPTQSSEKRNTAVMQSGLNRGLVAYYPFHGNANDASGNGLNGIINGGVTATTSVFGTTDGALTFDGSSGYISINDSQALLTFDARSQNYTVAAWVKLNSVSSDETIIIDRGTDNNSPCSYGLRFSGEFQRFLADMWDGSRVGPSSAGVDVINTSPVAVGQWYHVALVVTNGRMLLYINGVDETKPTGENGGVVPPGSGNTKNTDGVRDIGRFAPPSVGKMYLNGAASDLRIYNRALSSAEIQQLYQSNGYHSVHPAKEINRASVSRYVILGIAILVFIALAVAVIRLTLPRRRS
jgi:hypothetical protein